MKNYIPLFLFLFLVACNSAATPKFIREADINDPDSTINVEALVTLKKAKTYRFYIPSAFMSDQTIPAIDTSLSSNYLLLKNGNLEAKFYKDEFGNELLAINSIRMGEKCKQYFSYILQQGSAPQEMNQFETVFPNLSAHSFYEFGDKFLNQLEGDEQTAFAGYHLDLSKADSLGVQFMFCNENNSVNTEFLNSNGKIIYKGFVEL